MTARLRAGDLVRTAWQGVASRPQRSILAAVGIALGIATLVALVSVSASQRAQLLAELDRLGADLAVVSPGTGPDREPVPLPDAAPLTLLRQDGIARVGVFETAPDGLTVRRTDLVPETDTGGIAVVVARPDVRAAIGATMASGRWFDRATRALPMTVLGATAAERLGVSAGDRVVIGGRWYGVLGVLDSAGLAGGVDTAAILGDRWVRDAFAGESGVGDLTAIYVRAEPGRIDEVHGILAAAAAPGSSYVAVTRPSDLAVARATADDSLATLGLALAGIALLIGGIGIANTMVVAVMERRGEIGLRRALGARPGQIAAQFVAEAGMLSLLGGLGGAVVGAGAAVAVAAAGGRPVVLPIAALAGGPALAVVVGIVAGLPPAVRAARLAPTAALRSM
ncbi:ABC transporter permease [Microbacterium sp.]|uniref:ABC transporter permease n=1 Tax=Microbacterium sp. TaxID=51671 RepID=UPI0039E4E32B